MTGTQSTLERLARRVARLEALRRPGGFMAVVGPKDAVLRLTADQGNTSPGDARSVIIMSDGAGDYAAIVFDAIDNKLSIDALQAGLDLRTSELVIGDVPGSTLVRIVADNDNVTESHNPTLRFEQDGGTVTSDIGIQESANAPYWKGAIPSRAIASDGTDMGIIGGAKLYSVSLGGDVPVPNGTATTGGGIAMALSVDSRRAGALADVKVHADWDPTVAGYSTLVCQLRVAGVSEPDVVLVEEASLHLGRMSQAGCWQVALPTSGAVLIQARIYKLSSGGTAFLRQGNSKLSAIVHG